jgi:hypothetical protein
MTSFLYAKGIRIFDPSLYSWGFLVLGVRMLESHEDRRKIVLAGFRFHIAKPIAAAELVNRVVILARGAG